jgi:hypothetical protein
MSSGVLDKANLPDSFNINTGFNIKWKIVIQGLGISSPVIWGDKLFLTTAISKSDSFGMKPGIFGDGMPVPDSSLHDWKILCIDKNSGKTIWELHIPGYLKLNAIRNQLMPMHLSPRMVNMLLHFLDQKVCTVMIMKEI